MTYYSCRILVNFEYLPTAKLSCFDIQWKAHCNFWSWGHYHINTKATICDPHLNGPQYYVYRGCEISSIPRTPFIRTRTNTYLNIVIAYLPFKYGAVTYVKQAMNLPPCWYWVAFPLDYLYARFGCMGLFIDVC